MAVSIEPMILRPDLVVCGTSPVGLALADLAPGFGFDVTGPTPAADIGAFGATVPVQGGYGLSPQGNNRYLVVATQGRGDEAALQAVLSAPASYTAFVGNRAKLPALRLALGDAVPPDRLAALFGPTGPRYRGDHARGNRLVDLGAKGGPPPWRPKADRRRSGGFGDGW